MSIESWYISMKNGFHVAGHIPGDPNQIKLVWDETLQWLTKWVSQ